MKATALRVATVLAVVVAFAAVSAQAQSVVKKQKFTVPFEFNVGHKVLPAGEYTFISELQTIRIQSRDGKSNVITLPQRRVGVPTDGSEVKLTFRRYGDRYYLAQIWLPDGIGRELKRERRTETDVAQTFSTVDIVAAP